MSTDPDFHLLEKPEQIDRLIASASVMGLAHRVELLRHVRSSAINLIELQRHAEAPIRVMEKSPRPVCALIGDDDYRSTGPTGWASWQRLSYWGRCALVHGTGGDVASYRMAVGMTLSHRRMLLIETDSAHAHDWGAALHKWNIPAIGLLPPDGAHPVVPAQGAMQ